MSIVNFSYLTKWMPWIFFQYLRSNHTNVSFVSFPSFVLMSRLNKTAWTQFLQVRTYYWKLQSFIFSFLAEHITLEYLHVYIRRCLPLFHWNHTISNGFVNKFYFCFFLSRLANCQLIYFFLIINSKLTEIRCLL